MKKTSFKHYTLAALALSTSMLVGCLNNDSVGVAPEEAGFGSIAVTMNTGDMSAKSGLSKANLITLSKLVVTLTSNATPADTVRDTIAAGSQGFSATSTADQTVNKSYTLKALRTWKISVKTLDTRDSAVHVKVDSVVRLLAGQTVAKSLTLSPKFVMYKATFTFPDSLTSATGPARQKINVTRLVMKVDGITVVDSAATFVHSTAYSIFYDYVPVNQASTVELSVIGNLTGSSFPADSTLYRKTGIAISAQNPGVDSTRLVTLDYVGPVEGTSNVAVTIQKVGLYTMTITAPTNPVPKRK